MPQQSAVKDDQVEFYGAETYKLIAGCQKMRIESTPLETRDLDLRRVQPIENLTYGQDQRR